MNNNENPNITPQPLTPEQPNNDVVQPKVDEPINFTEEEQKFENTLVQEPITEPVAVAPQALTPEQPAPVAVPSEPSQIEEIKEVEPVTISAVPEPAPVAQEPVPAPVPQQEPAPVAQPEPQMAAPASEMPTEEKKKGNGKLIAIILVVVLLAVGGWFVVTQTDLLGKKEDKKEDKTEETVVEDPNVAKYEGIYKNADTIIYLHKNGGNQIAFTVDGGGFFQGNATVNGESATQSGSFSDKAKFKFNLTDGGLNLEIIDKQEDEIYLVEEGLYERVANYNKDELYKYAIGDPTYLTSKYSGYFKSGDIEMQLYQTSETEVQVHLVFKKNQDLPVFDETFEIAGDNRLVAKSFFDENEIQYELDFGDKEFTLKCNKEVFGYDEEDAKLELTYKFDREITQDEIIKENLKNY